MGSVAWLLPQGFPPSVAWGAVLEASVAGQLPSTGGGMAANHVPGVGPALPWGRGQSFSDVVESLQVELCAKYAMMHSHMLRIPSFFPQL